MFLSLVVLPKSVDSVACEFYCPIILFVNVCKKYYGEVGLQGALFANCGSCLHHVWERR